VSRVGNRRRATRLAVVRPGPFFATGTGRAEGSAQQGFTAADLSRFMVKPSDLPWGFRVHQASTDPAACLTDEPSDGTDRVLLDHLKDSGLLGCHQRSFAVDVPGGDIVPVSGMAFVFDAPTDGTFWMKDTLVPLSIAFIDDAGTIVTVLEMEPCEADPCPTYGADAPYVLAVEANGRYFDRMGIEEGDRAQLAEAADA